MTTKPRPSRRAARPAPAPADPAPVEGPPLTIVPGIKAGYQETPGENPRRLADLLPDPKNRRTHGPENVGMMTDALRAVGAARSIVIDERGEILAGNGIVQAARRVGLSKLQIVDADGDTVIAVRRRGLTDEQKRQLAIYDNRTGDLAEWNVAQLAEDFANGEELAPFFTDAELQAMKVMPKPEKTAANQALEGAFVVMVTCTDEQQQAELLERFKEEGLECKALVS